MAVDVFFPLSQMYPREAPGPDGMIAIFFQNYWHIIGLDVIDATLNF